MMLKKQLIQLVVAVALMIAVAGGADVVAHELGLDVTPQVYACGGTIGTGGGC